ncbi:MAG: DNA primase [Candidatus Dojkabacteria bacterium]
MDSNRDQIEEIRNRLDIVDVVGRYVQLKQAGKNFLGLCPFHTEKTASFVVSPELQRYKCFGCLASGDIFNFVQNIEHIDFPEALEKLAKEAGVVLKKRKENTIYTRLEEINKKAAIFFYKELLNPLNKSALEYVQSRGITKESIKTFGIGYASDGKKLLSFVQKDNKYSKDELINSGLFVLKEGKVRSKFYKRIMFPIRSSSGKVIAFTGRVLPSNDFGPKYMNSPETPIYHKKENVYGQYESRQEIRKQDLAIFCEGTTDVISTHQAGIKNIVAPLGTSLTKEQVEKISKLTKNILFIFDSDSAGQLALERAFLISQELGLTTFAANTLPYKDIDELVSKDSKKLKTLISKRVDTFTYLLISKLQNRDLNKLQEYTKVLSWIERMLKNERNKATFAFYVKRVREIAKIDVSNSSSSTTKLYTKKSHFKKSASSMPRTHIYTQLLLYLDEIKFPKYHVLKYFKGESVYEILRYIKNNPGITRTEILSHFQDDQTKRLIENMIFSFSGTETDEEELDSVYKNIVNDYFLKKEKDINMKISIAEAEGNQKESERLLRKYQTLTEEKRKHEQSSKL